MKTWKKVAIGFGSLYLVLMIAVALSPDKQSAGPQAKPATAVATPTPTKDMIAAAKEMCEAGLVKYLSDKRVHSGRELLGEHTDTAFYRESSSKNGVIESDFAMSFFATSHDIQALYNANCTVLYDKGGSDPAMFSHFQPDDPYDVYDPYVTTLGN